MTEYTRAYLDRMIALLHEVSIDEIDNAAALLWGNYQGGRRAIFCGNDDVEDHLSTLARFLHCNNVSSPRTPPGKGSLRGAS